MDVAPFPERKPFALFQQPCFGYVHQIVDAEFMVIQMIHIFFEKALIQPERADDFGRDLQLLLTSLTTALSAVSPIRTRPPGR